MKALSRITLLFASIVLFTVSGSMAQRVIQGTVYMDGEPAAGITVEAHRGTTMMTSFDGKYKVEVDSKSKYIRFTFIDETQKMDIDENTPDNVDYAFSGQLPSADPEVASGDVILKSYEELLQEQDKDFMNELSLYSEFYKQGDYLSAIPHWRNLYNKYPKSTSNIYIHGAKIYEYYIENAKTDEEKDKYIDEYMKLYDKKMKYFGQPGYNLGRKATSWLKYKLVDSLRITPLDVEQRTEVMKVGYEWLNQSMEQQGVETELAIFIQLMQTTVALFKLGDLPKETVVKNYEKMNELLNQIIADSPDESVRNDAKNTVQPFIESLFGRSGAADCDALVNIFTPQFEENNDDAEFIKGMLRRLRRARCDESELVELATIRLYELEPSAEAAFNMAHSYLKKDDIEKAREYYQQAITQETDPVLLASYYYERGLLRYARLKNYTGAREDARKALSEDPNMCDANILIGDIYVAAASSFEGTDLEKAAVFWVAVDYYNKARRNEECRVDAAQKALDYQKYFPNKEDAFMEGLQEGQSYKVGGWINESTTVRF